MVYVRSCRHGGDRRVCRGTAETGRSDHDLLRIYDLEDASPKLPKIVKSDQIAGYVTESFARKTGLPAGIPILGGLFDVNSCMLGSGITKEGQY